jgi:hypothetical protein
MRSKNMIILGKNINLGTVDGLKFKAKLVYVRKSGYLADIYVTLDDQSTKNNKKLGLLNVASELPLIKSIRNLVRENGLDGSKGVWSAESGIQGYKSIVFETNEIFEKSLTKKFGWKKLD